MFRVNNHQKRVENNKTRKWPDFNYTHKRKQREKTKLVRFPKIGVPYKISMINHGAALYEIHSIPKPLLEEISVMLK